MRYRRILIILLFNIEGSSRAGTAMGAAPDSRTYMSSEELAIMDISVLKGV